MYYIYILKWDKKHYIWYTSDIEKRLLKHKKSWTKTTRIMWRLDLIWYFIKETKTEAIKLEKMIKRDWHIEHWINHQTFVKMVAVAQLVE